MCIAIMKPKGIEISKEILKTCSEANKDGCGYAYVKDKTIYIKKFMKFDDFYKSYKEDKDYSNMLIHFRIATHGKVEVNNCHPFKLNDRMALIHNGVISGYGDRENKTDTKDFIDKVIGNISWKLWKNPSYRELVGKAIGYSKLVILDINDNTYIINENNGSWDEGVWYSNNSYKPKTYQCTIGSNDFYGWYKEKYNDAKPKKLSSLDYTDEEDDMTIYKCNKCGKEFTEYSLIGNPICDTCKSDDVKDIGFVYRKEKYYYKDMVK